MKAVLVICEGRSDVAFVRRSLTSISGYLQFNGEIRHLPSPFGDLRNKSSEGVIVEHIKACFGSKGPENERKLQQATFLVPPQFEDAILDEGREIIYLLVNSGGRDQHRSILELLRRVALALRFRDLDVTECATAFLLDANDRGVATTLHDFCDWYGEFFDSDSNFDHACWLRSGKFLVGTFICGGSDGKGALEDYIVPIVRSTWPERFEAACKFVDQNKVNSDKVSQSRAKQQRAIVTSVGQFNFPGEPISAIISDRKGIPDSNFKESNACKVLVDFLQNVPWTNS